MCSVGNYCQCSSTTRPRERNVGSRYCRSVVANITHHRSSASQVNLDGPTTNSQSPNHERPTELRSCRSAIPSLHELSPSCSTRPAMTLRTLKWQLKTYLFHIWCADEQKEHSPPPHLLTICQAGQPPVTQLDEDADDRLFQSVLYYPEHTLHQLLPDRRHNITYSLLPRRHEFTLSCGSHCILGSNFIVRQLLRTPIDCTVVKPAVQNQ